MKESNFLIIEDKKYKTPKSVIMINNNAVDTYGKLFLSEIISGEEDFERLGNNYLESECFNAYAEYHNIKVKDCDVNLVKKSLFAYYVNHSDDKYQLFYLEEIKTK